jgi:inorganic triphosphatase YgiF
MAVPPTSTPSSGVERECKLAAGGGFALPADVFRDEGLDLEPEVDVELDAVYHDTADLRLARDGVTLRHRSGDGVPRWTLKLPARGAGPGTLHRRELDVEDPAGDPAGPPPRPLVELVSAYRRTAPLVPVARLRTLRRRLRLVDGTGRPLGELDDDEVRVLPGTGGDGEPAVVSFRELELELDPRAPDDLLPRLTTRLREAGAVAAEQTPKLVRALGPAALAPPDVVAEPAPPGATVAEELRAALARGTRALIDADPALRLGDDPGAADRAREAAGQLLGVIGTFATVIPQGWRDRVGAGLDSLLTALGPGLGGVGGCPAFLRTSAYRELLEELVAGPWSGGVAA